MDFTHVFIGIGTAVVFVILGNWIGKTNSDEIKEGVFKLYLHKSVKYIAWFFIFSGVFLFFAFALFSQVTSTLSFAFGLLFLIVLISNGWLILKAIRNYKIIYSDKGIEYFGLNGKKYSFNWSEVEQIKFSSFKGANLIYIKGKKITVHEFLKGKSDFLNFAKLKLDKDQVSKLRV